MADPTIPAVRLTSKTTGESRNDLVARIPTITDKWTDHNESELGMVLLTTLCGMLETLNFELDFRAGETTRTHVRLRPNGVRLFSLIGYRFKRKSPARTTLRFTLSKPAVKSVYIQSYLDPNVTEAKTSGGRSISFCPTTTVVIPPGSNQVLVTALQGTRAQETFTANTDPNQIFTLTQTDVGEDTLKVFVNDVLWREVEHFVESTNLSRHYRVITDEFGVVRLLFGDGLSGAIPSGTIKAVYLKTSGKQGNLIGKNRVTTVATQPRDADNVVVAAAVTNLEDATGGDDEEDLWRAKKQAPRQYAAQQRAVTHDDYVAWAEGFSGIRQATAIDIRDTINLKNGQATSFQIDYHQIKIPIIPVDGVRPSAALKRGLQDYLDKLKTVPDDVEVIDPVYVPVPVQVNLVIRKNYDQSVVKAAVTAAIETFFNIATAPSEEIKIGGETEGMQFGMDVAFSRLLAAIQAVPGVYSITELQPNNDIAVDPFEIAILDTGSPIINVVGTA